MRRLADMNRPRVLLADDHTLLLGAFEKLLAPECDVVGGVSDGRALMAAAEKLQPDVVVLDVAMPLLNGIDAGREIKRMNPRIKLVFLTMSEDPDVAAEALRIGASAYLLKRCAAAELLTAIHEVMQGRSYLTPLVTDGLVGSLLHPAEPRSARELTPRQREVLQLLAEGRSNKEIGTALRITTKTAETHRARLMAKLGVHSVAELVRYAIRNKIVEP